MSMFTWPSARRITYFKRFKMEVDLGDEPPAATLQEDYYLLPWDDALLEPHANTLFHCFQDELDTVIFPSLGDRQGCRHLMTEIRAKPGFLSAATWLVGCSKGYCGTVQGRRESGGVGGIQNLGIAAAHRGRGLGWVLLVHALRGIRRAGLKRAFLEVTAENESAIRLYRRLGFQRRKTIYKAVEAGVTYAELVARAEQRGFVPSWQGQI